MHAQLGQIMDNKTQKDQKKPTATSGEPGAKTGNCTCPLHTHSTAKGVGEPSVTPLS